MRKNHPKYPWHKCDWCGRFIPIHDFDMGLAIRRMVSPDTAFTAETYENKCRKCNEEEAKRRSKRALDRMEYEQKYPTSSSAS